MVLRLIKRDTRSATKKATDIPILCQITYQGFTLAPRHDDGQRGKELKTISSQELLKKLSTFRLVTRHEKYDS